MKKFLIVLNLVLSFVFVGCTIETNPNDNNISVNSISILKDGVDVDELNVYVNDSFTFEADVTNQIKETLIWESSDSKIVEIDSNGNAKAVSKGNVVITVTVQNYPYITDSVVVKATNKIQQLGVGSGLTKDDPIFIGNEGEDEPIEIYFIEMQHIYADSIFIKKGNVEILIDAGFEYDGTFVNKVITQYCTDGI